VLDVDVQCVCALTEAREIRDVAKAVACERCALETELFRFPRESLRRRRACRKRQRDQRCNAPRG
jgi:hypothetical protein